MTNDKKPDPTKPFRDATAPDAQERIRLALMKMATDFQKQEADKKILAAEKMRNDRKQREISDTEKKRFDRRYAEQKRMREIELGYVHPDVAGFHANAKPPTPAEDKEMQRKAWAQVRVDAANMGTKIDQQVDARLANQVEHIAKPDRVKVAEEFRQARSERIASFKQAARDKERDRGLGD